MKPKKLPDQFHRANLLLDKIDLKAESTWAIFYIVENTTDSELIEKEALQRVLPVNEKSHEFHFYGKQAQRWENAFDLADITAHPNASDEEIALTMVYHDLDEFINTLQEEISSRHFSPHDTYLLYDDETLYKYVLSKLKY